MKPTAVKGHNKYLSAYRLATVNRKAFIASFLSSLLYLPLSLVVTYFAWYSLYRYLGAAIIDTYTLPKLFAYFFVVKILAQATSYFTNISYTIWTEITQGTVSKFLCRPIGYIRYHFFYGLGYAQYNFLIIVPVLLIGAMIPGFAQTSVLSLSAFLLSLVFAAVVAFLLYFTVGIVSFWTEAIFGLRDLVGHVGSVFSGALIPLPLLPAAVGRIAQFLPFRAMVEIPVSIYMESLEGSAILSKLGLQILWIAVMALVLNVLWRFGVRKYEAGGG